MFREPHGFQVATPYFSPSSLKRGPRVAERSSKLATATACPRISTRPAGNREVPVQSPLDLHHHLQPVGLEAGRPDEIPPMPRNARPLRGRRWQPSPQRRPHAGWPDRAPPGRGGGNGRRLGKYGESIYGTRGGPWKPTRSLASTRAKAIPFTCTCPVGTAKRSPCPTSPAISSAVRVLTGGTARVRQAAGTIAIDIGPPVVPPAGQRRRIASAGTQAGQTSPRLTPS